MPSQLPASTQRYAGVDVLRGLSIVSVVLYHVRLVMAYTNRPLDHLLPGTLFTVLFNNTMDGVPVFFAVSGFLITHTCLRRFGSLADVVPRVFYRIRFARIAPLLLLVLTVLSILYRANVFGYRFAEGGVSWARMVLAALTFHVNWLEAAHGYLPPPWDILWSLSVEEMFYLFFPLACLLLRLRRGRVPFAALLLALLVAGPFARQSGNPIWRLTSYLGGMDCIALGCITALLADWCRHHRRVPGNRTLLAIAGLGIADIALMIRPDNVGYRYPLWNSGTWTTAMITGVCAVMFSTVLRNRAGRAWSAPLRWFGSHSYELYMTHQSVLFAVGALCLRLGATSGRSLLVWAAAMFALTAPVGWLLARYFTEPMNRRLRGARPPRPAAA